MSADLQGAALIDAASSIAVQAHKGQVDKCGRPYILHPMRVMHSLEVQGASDHVLATALLHDVVEDCPQWSLIRLNHFGLPVEVVSAVQAITHLSGEPNVDYLQRVIRNEIARQVKIEDVLDNLSPLRLYGASEGDRVRLMQKYHRALDVLLAA